MRRTIGLQIAANKKLGDRIERLLPPLFDPRLDSFQRLTRMRGDRC